MRWVRAFLVRLAGCVWRSRRERELSDEIESHLQLHVDDNVRAGMSPDEARRQAVLKLGGIEQVKEAMRDRQRLPWLEHLAQDVRFAFRSLRKSPGFTTVSVFTLALCIGANSAVFSVVHAILLKPYPWPDSDRLVYVHNTEPLRGRDRANCSIPDYLDRRKGVMAFEESALVTGAVLSLTSGDLPERLEGLTVTPSLFSLLQARPALGRTFSEDDAKVGAAKTVVLSGALWQNRFGAKPDIINTEIRLNGEPHTVIGVMPPTFYFPRPSVQLWRPYTFTESQKSDSGRTLTISTMFARLKRGASIEQAQREVTAIHKANAERLPQIKALWETTGLGGLVVGFLEEQVKNVRAMLWLIQGAVAASMLIGCANVASLLLARAYARERELAIRAALGAGRGRLIRHLLTESILLFVAGGLLGLVVAFWGIDALKNLGADNLPRGFGVSLDFAVFGFTLVCAIATGLAFGALPAWFATGSDNATTLKDAGPRATTSRRLISLRSTLVVSEITFALMLLSTAALLIKGFLRLQEINPGFVRENVLTASLPLTVTRTGPPGEKRTLFYGQLLARVRALPGVKSAAGGEIPFARSGDNASDAAGFGYGIEGFTPPADQPPLRARHSIVTPDFFKTMGIPLLLGRDFNEGDSHTAEDVVVIDKILADRHWPGEDPIGKRLTYQTKAVPNTTIQEPRKWSIIGVVAPVKRGSLETENSRETIYFSVLQLYMPTGKLVVKTEGPPGLVTAPLCAAVQSFDPNLPLYDIKTMETRMEESMERRRTPMMLFAVFAGLALLLASIGVYGVLAFAVGQRTQEFGVRIALGANRADILRLVLRQGTRLVSIGLVLGLGGYFALSTFIRKLLFSVETTDYAALLIAPATLALVALAACLIPACRATKVDPIVALRAE